MEKKNIIVMFGGKSVEHDISILTFLQTMKNIDLKKYNVFPIYINKQSHMFLVKEWQKVETYTNVKSAMEITFVGNVLHKKTKFGLKKVASIDCALLCTHGTNVEDGVLQGYLSHLNIPHTCSSVLSSAINMDKVIMKQVLINNNFPCVDYISFTKTDFLTDEKTIIRELEENLNYPVIVKPANLGSSIGISRCKNLEELKNAISIAMHYDNKIIVEEVVLNLREINCAVLGDGNDITISKLEEPYGWESFLDFNEKYIKEGKKTTNVKLDKELKHKIYTLSINAFKVMNCSGVVRIDFLINDKSKEVYINELNTIPGSLAFYLFDGILSFSQLIDKLIDIALLKQEKTKELTFDFTSKALEKTSNLKTRK